MKDYLKDGVALVIAVAVGIYVGAFAVHSTPQLGGDFPGGVSSAPLHAATTTGGLTGNGYIYPSGSFVDDAANGLSVGGSDQYHGLTQYITASGTPASVVTLGPLGATTSTATSSVTIPETQGLSVGSICSGSAATTTVYVSGCVLTSTDGATGTALVAYSNITNAALPVPTSTLFRISFDQLPY